MKTKTILVHASNTTMLNSNFDRTYRDGAKRNRGGGHLLNLLYFRSSLS